MGRKNCHYHSALTFLEIVISLAILSVIFVAGTFMFQVALENIKRSNLEIAATNFTRGIMAEIMTRRFDENLTPPWSSLAQLGCINTGYCDPGEVYLDRSTYDDVDDYHKFYLRPATGIDGQVVDLGLGPIRFQINSIAVEYVDEEMDYSATPTNHKKIKLNVKTLICYDTGPNCNTSKEAIPLTTLYEVKAADVD